MNKELEISNISYCVQALHSAKKQKVPHVMIIKPKTEKRRDVQNRLMWHWYHQLCNCVHMHGMTKTDLIRFNKLTLGTPILCRREEFNKLWLSLEQLTYEQKLLAMDLIDITSIMNVKEMSEYLKEFEIHWSQQGCYLTNGEDMYYKAMGYKK